MMRYGNSCYITYSWKGKLKCNVLSHISSLLHSVERKNCVFFHVFMRVIWIPVTSLAVLYTWKIPPQFHLLQKWSCSPVCSSLMNISYKTELTHSGSKQSNNLNHILWKNKTIGVHVARRLNLTTKTSSYHTHTHFLRICIWRKIIIKTIILCTYLVETRSKTSLLGRCKDERVVIISEHFVGNSFKCPRSGADFFWKLHIK